ncbi:oxidoreductase [Streptomyces bingchenggensis BCW-1]|uniref:Oxidoreductase n=1 Tax=Streptomyces bingchenggensis (strain BCW-1) TaxID=749414 RepID=D7BRK0_STRBB|nr:oxidoreductase [Streptomyces bingchenggensis BCW-1]
MSTEQHKIGSGFGAHSTADDVLTGIDLSGRTALVTGGYSGLGLETTRALARAGAHVVVLALAPGGARVVSVASSGRFLSGIRWDDLHFRTGYDRWSAYAQSKTANALFALHLDTLGGDSGVHAFALHSPGQHPHRCSKSR